MMVTNYTSPNSLHYFCRIYDTGSEALLNSVRCSKICPLLAKDTISSGISCPFIGVIGWIIKELGKYQRLQTFPTQWKGIMRNCSWLHTFSCGWAGRMINNFHAVVENFTAYWFLNIWKERGSFDKRKVSRKMKNLWLSQNERKGQALHTLFLEFNCLDICRRNLYREKDWLFRFDHRQRWYRV